jgi:hypothetical protein
MHACVHDTHVDMLLAVAKVLTRMKAQLPGSLKFIFQPAEEGVPTNERGCVFRGCVEFHPRHRRLRVIAGQVRKRAVVQFLLTYSPNRPTS